MPFLEERDTDVITHIPEYYKGKTIFISGGSGFMGKVLIEKLLYSCSELDKIYLMLRKKKGVEPEDRIAAIYDSHCFDRLRKEKPSLFKSKVFIIAGDIGEDGLGLSVEDRTDIINNTQIIFHVAATVRFDDPLKVAVRMNVRGTVQMLELAKEVRYLESFIHVSTAYSNTIREPIEEVMYPPLADWRDTLQICDEIDDRTLKALTAKYLGEMPNTYGFTKQLAEHAVFEYKGILPIIIIRPSIVMSSIYEPIPGWNESFNGPIGIIVGMAQGILRTLLAKPDTVTDYIPVDVAIKSFITASWIRGTIKLESTDDIPIYNCCAGDLSKITVLDEFNIGKQLVTTMPLSNTFWIYGGTITTSLFLFNIRVFLYQLLPAVFMDMVLWLLGKKTLLIKIQRRIYMANLLLQYYLTRKWTFSNINFIELRSKIKEGDKKEFFYNLEDIDIYEYFRQSCILSRKYILNETDDLEQNKIHYQRLVILDKLFKCIFYGLLFWWIMKTEFVNNLFNYFVN